MQQEIIRDYLSLGIGTFSKVYIDGEKGGGLFTPSKIDYEGLVPVIGSFYLIDTDVIRYFRLRVTRMHLPTETT